MKDVHEVSGSTLCCVLELHTTSFAKGALYRGLINPGVLTGIWKMYES